MVVSGCTVAVAMAGMFLSGSAIFSSLAVGAILVVAVSVLGSITVLPAVLAKLGRWVDRPRVPFLHRLTLRPGAAAPAVVGAAAADAAPPGAGARRSAPARCSCWPCRPLGMRTRCRGTADLPRSIPAMQSYDRLTAAFPSEGAVRRRRGRAPAGAGRRGAGRRCSTSSGRAGGRPALRAPAGEPEVEVSADGRVSRAVTWRSRTRDDSPGGEQALRVLRGPLVPETVGRVPGAEVAVSGDTAASVDFSPLLSDAAAVRDRVRARR